MYKRQVKEFQQKLDVYQKEKALLAEYAGKPSVTKDGTKVELVCNIGKPEDAKKVVECDGEGVGLFRTEFLFMDRDSIPVSYTHLDVYKRQVVGLNTCEQRQRSPKSSWEVKELISVSYASCWLGYSSL